LAAEERDNVHQALAELQQDSAQQISRLQQEVQLLQAKYDQMLTMRTDMT